MCQLSQQHGVAATQVRGQEALPILAARKVSTADRQPRAVVAYKARHIVHKHHG